MKLDKHPNAEALIFDLDGTLSDSLPVHVAAWHKVCEHFGCTFDAGMMAEMTGRPTKDFAERVMRENGRADLNPDDMVRMKHRLFGENLGNLVAHSAVVALVHQYHGKIPLAVGTGANKISAMLQLKKLGITDKFDVIITAEDVSKHKPEPDTFLKCAELMGVAPEKCEVFEDGILGIRAAKSAGMFCTDVRPFYS